MNVKNIETNPSTAPDIIEKAIENVESILEKCFPDHIEFEKGKYTITRGSTQVMVIVRPFTANDCVVEFVATVVSGAKIDIDLMHFLLKKNSELHLGGFGLLFDNTIVYQHSLSGKHTAENEFADALNAVAAIADYYDDEIIKIAGGKRACDLEIDIEEE